MKTASVVYSRYHKDSIIHGNIAASRIQDNFILALRELGFDEVYFAGQEDGSYSDDILKSNVIITTPLGTYKIKPKLSNKTKLYTIANNTHYAVKNKRMSQSAEKWEVPLEGTSDPEIFEFAYRQCDYLLVGENKHGIQNFIENGIPRDKIFKWNNGVDSFWCPTSKKNTDTFDFIYWTADAGLRKGLPSLVEGWKKWYNGQKSRLLIFGMRSLVTSKYLGNNTVIDGHVPGIYGRIETFSGQNRFIRDMLSQSHVLIFPTLEDAEPATVLEGASCGLPIITTIESGFDFPSYIADIVEADNPDSIADSFENWYNRGTYHAEILGEECVIPYIKENYSWDNARRIIRDIIEQTGGI